MNIMKIIDLMEYSWNINRHLGLHRGILGTCHVDGDFEVNPKSKLTPLPGRSLGGRHGVWVCATCWCRDIQIGRERERDVVHAYTHP